MKGVKIGEIQCIFFYQPNKSYVDLTFGWWEAGRVKSDTSTSINNILSAHPHCSQFYPVNSWPLVPVSSGLIVF